MAAAAAAAAACLPDSAADSMKPLYCSVCRENFHPKSHLPRVLPCHHSFCGDCIDKFKQDGQVKCPLCRKVARARGPFPVDAVHVTYLELTVANWAEEAPPCESCPDEAKATSRCQDCNTNLCDACCNAHRRVQLTRHHAILDLKEIAQSPELLKQASEKCDIHKERPFEFFCKTCDKPLCAACAAMLHRDGHRVVELSDIMNTWKQKVISDCKDFSETIDGLEVKAASLKTILEHMDTDHNHAIEDIEKTFDELQAALNGRKAAILADLAAKVKANRLALEEELATVESQISSIRATRDHSRCLVQYGLPSQFVAHVKEMENPVLLQEAKKVKKALTPARPIGLNRKGLQQVKTAFEKFGTLYDGNITLNLEDVQHLSDVFQGSDVAYFCDNVWRIQARSSSHEGCRWLDLVLDCNMTHDRPWSFKVISSMKVLNFREKMNTKRKTAVHYFSAEETRMKLPTFMTMSRLTDPMKGHVKVGKVCIEGSLSLDLSEGLVLPEETDDETEEDEDRAR